MRITIDIDEQRAATTTLVAPGTNGQATDAGGPPAALLQTLAPRALAGTRQPTAGNDGGPPPQHLLQALLSTPSPRTNGADASDGGAARG